MKSLIRFDPARLASLLQGGILVHTDDRPIAPMLLKDALNPWVIWSS
jgi:hypothetical protein